MNSKRVATGRTIAAMAVVAILALGFTSFLSLVSPIQSVHAQTLTPWATTTSLPAGLEVYGDHSCVISGGYIYCMASNFNANSVYYAPLTQSGIGTWTQTNSYPTDNGGQSCAASGGYVYCVLGGILATNYTAAVYYAPLSSSGVGAWKSTTSYPTPTDGAMCAISGEYIYCIGGYGPTGLTGAVYYAPISSSGVGAWTTTTSYPQVASVVGLQNASCLAVGDYIYCIGGLEGASTESGNYVYFAQVSSSGRLGAWTQTSSYPSGVDDPSCVAASGYINCIAGEIAASDGEELSAAVYYAPITSSGALGQWTGAAPYPEPTIDPACVSSAGYIYCVGGFPLSLVLAVIPSTSAVYYAQASSIQSALLLSVATQNTGGQNLTGYYTVLFDQSGTNILTTGFSPTTFTLNSGQSYTVQVDDYGSCTFSHWADTGSTDPQRTITAATTDVQLTAVYSCATSTINIAATNGLGSPLVGYYATLSTAGGTLLQRCYSPCSLTVDNGQTYQIRVANYGGETFSRWSDNAGTVNTWGGSHTVSVPATSTTINLTAVYSP